MDLTHETIRNQRTSEMPSRATENTFEIHNILVGIITSIIASYVAIMLLDEMDKNITQRGVR